MKQVFDVTMKLVSEQTEIHRISMINWQDKCWKRTTLLTDRVVQLAINSESLRILRFSIARGENQ